MLEDAFTGFKCEVESVVIRITLFQRVDHAQALEVVLKACALRIVRLQTIVQRILARVAKRRVAKIMCQRNGFDQILVDLQGTGNRSAQLGDLQRMGEARTKEVTLVIQENLGLVNEPAERRGMHDAVAVALEV